MENVWSSELLRFSNVDLEALAVDMKDVYTYA